MKRVKQLLSAMGALITPKDEEFVKQHLNLSEQKLFHQMSIPDRRHCLNVTKTVITLAEKNQVANLNILVKAALLHDVGRQGGTVSTVDKVIGVILRAVLGDKMVEKWSKVGRGSRWKNLRNALYVNAHHPRIGAELLRNSGTQAEVVQLVSCHHLPAQLKDTIELTLLRKADDEN